MTTQDPHFRSPFHSLALALWLAMAVVPSLLTSNPVYLAICLLLVGWTHRQVARHSPTADTWGSFARFALFFVVFTLVFNVLMGAGGDTVLVELPAWRVANDQGATLFQLGGPLTLESLVLGTVRAMALLSVIYALATFNTLVDHTQLLRGLPRWLDQAAVIVSIAIAFMPQLVKAQRDVRQALAMRGHRLRKLRDFLPLVLILLDEALERAINLAESMEARGYSGPPQPPSQRRRPRHFIAGGLLLLCIGVVFDDLSLPGDSVAPSPGSLASQVLATWPQILSGIGLGLIVAALWSIDRRSHRSRYRRQIWRRRDSALSVTSMLAAAILIALYVDDRAPFFYAVFPKVQVPTTEWMITLPLLAILGPLLFLPSPPSATARSER